MTPDLAGRIAVVTGSFRPVYEQRRAAMDTALDRMEAP